MSRLVLIDGNALGYQNQHGTKLHSGGMETQAVYGFLRSLREICNHYPKHTIVVLWDGRAQWRFDLHPEYKSNRDNDPKKVAVKEAYAKQRPFIQKAVKALGIAQVTYFNYEADDLAGYLVGKYMPMTGAREAQEIVLITGDRDWLQLVRPGVVWRDLRDDSRVITAENFYLKTGYKTPMAFLQGKCLQGDTSDVIPGVGGIGEKGAPEFLAEFGSVSEFWRRCASGEFAPKKKAHINLASEDGRKAFTRNMRLMNLLKSPISTDTTIDANREAIYPKTTDKEAFAEVCEELSFVSILRDLDNFMSFFEQRKRK